MTRKGPARQQRDENRAACRQRRGLSPEALSPLAGPALRSPFCAPVPLLCSDRSPRTFPYLHVYMTVTPSAGLQKSQCASGSWGITQTSSSMCRPGADWERRGARTAAGGHAWGLNRTSGASTKTPPRWPTPRGDGAGLDRRLHLEGSRACTRRTLFLHLCLPRRACSQRQTVLQTGTHSHAPSFGSLGLLCVLVFGFKSITVSLLPQCLVANNCTELAVKLDTAIAVEKSHTYFI